MNRNTSQTTKAAVAAPPIEVMTGEPAPEARLVTTSMTPAPTSLSDRGSRRNAAILITGAGGEVGHGLIFKRHGDRRTHLPHELQVLDQEQVIGRGDAEGTDLSDSELYFVDLFDWDPEGYRDLALVLAMVTVSPNAPDLRGRYVLLERGSVSVLLTDHDAGL